MSGNVRQLPSRSTLVPQDLREAIERSIREEIRACGLLNDYSACHPLPSDPDAELTINGALASGEVSIVELYDLSSEDFYDRGQRYFFAKFEAASAADVKLNRELLVASVASEGISPDALAPEIEWLFSQPVCYPDDARRAAKSIIECSKRRRLIAAIQRLDVSLRLGERSYDDGVEQLSKLFTKAKEIR